MAAGEDHGAMLTRANLNILLARQGRFSAAAEEVERARELAADSADPEVRARALTLAADHLLRTDGDLLLALAALRRARATAFPDGTYGLKYSVLFKLALLLFDLGRYDEVVATFDRLEELVRAEGRTAGLARIAFNRINARQAQLEQTPDDEGLEELRRWVEEALDLGRNTGDDIVELRSHALLAQIDMLADPERARRHVALCLERAAAFDQDPLAANCLRVQALLEMRTSPSAALATTARVLALADAVDSDEDRAHGWRVRMRVAWAALPYEEALAQGLEALGAIESLRDGQRDDGLVHGWTDPRDLHGAGDG